MTYANCVEAGRSELDPGLLAFQVINAKYGHASLLAAPKASARPYLHMNAPPDPSQSKRLSVRPEWRDNRLSLVASIKPSPHAAEAIKSPAMAQSPLTQQTRPEVFEPKVVTLYKRLFRV